MHLLNFAEPNVQQSVVVTQTNRERDRDGLTDRHIIIGKDRRGWKREAAMVVTFLTLALSDSERRRRTRRCRYASMQSHAIHGPHAIDQGPTNRPSGPF